MTEDLKDAVRLLFECADELRLHDEEYKHITRPTLKQRLAAFLSLHGVGTPEEAADKLVTAEYEQSIPQQLTNLERKLDHLRGIVESRFNRLDGGSGLH